ncbi:MAG: pilus assembly PilX N-terminal domain-containing protein, partial [Actinomycetota bacterium]|nr:pilus assembly PilX N-terminal domain-containing protein [Actinomycetota bacterium]
MKKTFFARMRNEAGVAMVTVIFIGAALTVLVSAAAISTISELRASTDDRRSAEALSYAEAGIDRLMRFLRVGNVTWAKLIRAGCEDVDGIQVPEGIVGSGSFRATLKVYEPNPPTGNSVDQVVPGACSYRATVPNDPQGQFFVITSEGSRPTAKRVVQQIVRIKPLGLPVGIYANSIEAGGNPNMVGISMFSETQIRGRDKLAFNGIDPYYFMSDVFPDGVVGRSPTEHAPAGAHAAIGIFEKQNGTKPEFPGPAPMTTKNCIANVGGAPRQSLWDSDGSAATGAITSGCSGQTGYPTTSKFTTANLDNIRPHVLDEQDHQALRDAAKEGGLYCSIANGTGACTLLGETVSFQSVWSDGHINPLF